MTDDGPEWLDDSDIEDAAPTLDNALGIGAATEIRPPASGAGELYPPTCFACGQATSSRDTKPVSEPPRPAIATMSQRDVDAELHALLDEAMSDERRIMLFMLRRFVALGQRCYGPLDLATDRRNGLRELNEEVGDAMFYVAFAALKRELHGE